MDESYKKKLEGLQRGSGAARPMVPAKTNMFQPNMTEEEMELIRQAQLLAVKNAPLTPQPKTAKDLLLEDADFNAQMNELDEVPTAMAGEQGNLTPEEIQKVTRFQKLFRK